MPKWNEFNDGGSTSDRLRERESQRKVAQQQLGAQPFDFGIGDRQRQARELANEQRREQMRGPSQADMAWANFQNNYRDPHLAALQPMIGGAGMPYPMENSSYGTQYGSGTYANWTAPLPVWANPQQPSMPVYQRPPVRFGIPANSTYGMNSSGASGYSMADILRPLAMNATGAQSGGGTSGGGTSGGGWTSGGGGGGTDWWGNPTGKQGADWVNAMARWSIE